MFSKVAAKASLCKHHYLILHWVHYVIGYIMPDTIFCINVINSQQDYTISLSIANSLTAINIFFSCAMYDQYFIDSLINSYGVQEMIDQYFFDSLINSYGVREMIVLLS